VFEIMFNSIMPIFVVVGLAALFARSFNPDPTALSGVVLYLFIPFLVFNGIADTQISGSEALQIGAMAFGISGVMALIGMGIERALNLDRRTGSALILTLILVNAANYGIPLNTFAFGDTPERAALAEERALIYYVASVIVSNTLGIYFASRGSVSTREALLNIVRVPLIYAAILGFMVNVAEVTIPVALERPFDLLADAAIPGMLALLGIQLARASIRGQIQLILLTSGVKLIVAPVVAIILAAVLGLTGLTRDVSIVQSSMPTAVIAGVFATQFRADSEFVTSVILVSTIASIISLSVLLTVLI